MKIKFILIFILLLYVINTFAQSPKLKNNNIYLIYGNLNPDNKALNGFVDLTYFNNSGSALNEIYFKLWANSFKKKNTTFAQKLIQDKKTEIYFAKEKELGGYTGLKFLIDGKELSTGYKDDNKVYIKVKLDKPLNPNDFIKLKIEYNLKIPKCFYKLGYSEEQYNMVGWYPKPVVYEDNEWIFDDINSCPISYNEPADYTVMLHIPEHYIIASSGKLNNPKEDAFISKRIKTTSNNEKIPITTQHPVNFKTLKFEAKNIKEFTWFANPQFKIVSDTINDIPLFIYFSGHIQQAKISEIMQKYSELFALYRSGILTYYFPKLNLIISDDIFEEESYPENIAFNIKTAQSENSDISSKILNGINENLRARIITNPYKYPWIYNGFTQFPVQNSVDSIYSGSKDIFDKHIFTNISLGFSMETTLKPANLDAAQYQNCTELSYFTYCKTTLSLNYLENYMGEKWFSSVYWDFVKKYEYRNITPDIIRQYFEEKSKLDLTWFFDGLLGTADPFRYSIKNIERNDNLLSVTIENKGKFKIPFEIGTLNKDSIIHFQTIEGFLGNKTIVLVIDSADKIKIDPHNLYYKSKDIKTESFIKKTLIKPANISINSDYGHSNFFIPFLGFNKSDGIMLGGFLSDMRKTHNRYSLIALYGFRSKSLIGAGDYKFRFIPINENKIIETGIEAKSFHKLKNDDFNLRYKRLSLIFSIINKNKSNKTKNKISLKTSVIEDESFSGQGIDKFHRFLTKISYHNYAGNAITPFEYKIALEHQYYEYNNKNQYIKVEGELKTAYMYKNKRFFRVRIYGATYLYNTNIFSTANYSGTLSLIGYGMNDYGYEHYFIDRLGQSGFWSRQLTMNTGGFKTALGTAYSIGQSNKYVVSANIIMDLPVKFFIKPYFDIGLYGDLPTISDGYSNKMLYSSGFVFEIIKNYFSFYLPLLNSKEIENIYIENPGILKRISFFVKFDFLNDLK